jgi:ABC-type lipopolysaccharide export system ATPase subunit
VMHGTSAELTNNQQVRAAYLGIEVPSEAMPGRE